MADRYWVGGSGTWNTTNTTNWSATSGGASGASVPAVTDAVIIDLAGPYTVTLNGSNPRCLSLNITGANVTIAGAAGGAVDVRGNVVIASTTVWTATGTIGLNSTTTANFNTNGVSLSAGIVVGNGGVYTLQNNLTTTGDMNVQVGTFTANNFNVTIGTFNTIGTLNRTLNMGTGTWTITGSGATAWSFASATNLTVNASTSTINMTSASAKTFTGQGKTYGTINQGGAGALTLVGANTFANITSTSAPSTIIFPASTTTTVSAFDVAGTAGNLVTLNSSTAGTAATLSDTLGIINANYLNIKDITATGGATWNAGANSVDSGNNTGWIFSGSVLGPRYWVGGAGTWDASTAANWALTSGGVGGATAPGSTNDAVFDAASNATAYTVTMGAGAVCADLTMAGPASGNVTWAGSTALSVYGSMTLAATGITRSYTGAITFASTATGKTITTNGVSLSGSAVTFDGVGGGWTLGSALTVSGVTLTNGTVNANVYNVMAGTFSSSNSNVRTVSLGSGTWTLSASGTAWSCATATNLTVTPGSSTISLTAATSKTFAGGSKTYGTINQGGAGALTITGANTFTNITATSAPSTITFPASTTTTVSAFSVSGTAGNLVTLNSSTAGTRATLSDASGTVNRDYLSIQDISATGGADWYAGDNSVDSGNNLGWIFTASPVVTSSSTPYVQLRSFTERGRD